MPFWCDACHSGASDHPVDATTDASTSCHDAQPGVATHRGHNPCSFGDPRLFQHLDFFQFAEFGRRLSNLFVGVVPKDKCAKIDKLMKEYDEKCVKALKLRIQFDKY